MFDIYIKNTADKGRGIFANQDIEPNSCIDFAPTIPFSNFEDVDKTVFRNYYFSPRPEVAVNIGVLILGYMSICNHSKTPNARIEFSNSDIGIVARLISTRNISQHSEIMIDYGNVWFEVE